MNTSERKIYYYDTDCGGVVYYANYLRFFEEARSAYLESLGFSVSALAAKNVLFAVRRQEVDYKAPARYGDVLRIKTEVSEISNYRIQFRYEIEGPDNKQLTKGMTDLVCVNEKFQLNEIPKEVSQAVKKEAGIK